MPLKLPDVPSKDIPNALWQFIIAIRKAVIITKQDLIDLNLIDSSDQRIDDNGDAIDE